MPAAPVFRTLLLHARDPRVFETLVARYPGAQRLRDGVAIPLNDEGPEEVLALCCAARVPVTASEVTGCDQGFAG
jgi:hypothetical protein